MLPAYIGQSDREGSGIFDPIRETGVEPIFYSVDAKLRPNQNEIEARLDSNPVDVFLAVHFFGFCHLNMNRIQDACRRSNTVLLEDCAHVGFAIPSALGSYGDFSFYSLHKFFPVPTGGVLQTNHPRNSIDHGPKPPPCDQAIIDRVNSSDLQQITDRRIQNFNFLASAFRDTAGVEPLWSLPQNCVPHNFPVRIQHGLREKLYFHLIDQGIRTTALYYQLVEEIPRNRYPISHDLSKHILNFPVHQNISLPELEELIACVKLFFTANDRQP
jgi:dTDP-4-amino-4,6-dideoxygalactose transaminase